MLPEPPLPLPPQDTFQPDVSASSGSQLSVVTLVPPTPDHPSPNSASTPQSVQLSQQQDRATLVTQINSFGLFRIYDQNCTPINDPEDQCSDPPVVPQLEVATETPQLSNPFYPYPNENSWLIGDWYWNQGVHKSKSGFEKLIRIIGNVDFRSEDLRYTNWASIDRDLGCLDVHTTFGASSSHMDELDSQHWLAEEDGWMRRNITISVPFPRRSLHPGPRDYTISNFYRRSLLSIIRDKLSDPLRCRSFRFEPYHLRWKRSSVDDDIRVYGELFYSQAFVTAHRELQDAVPDPDCNLPRRIVALMFWSDATHLTSFGDAKLWPLYLFFGNESKYQRCSPTANLCSHAAYFQTVRVQSS